MSIVRNEKIIMNMRFTFYKMCHRDTFGNQIMPARGSGFEMLNKNLLHDAVDQFGNNLLKQAKKLNVNLSDHLESASEAIKQNYFTYVDNQELLPSDAELTEQFQIERKGYND